MQNRVRYITLCCTLGISVMTLAGCTRANSQAVQTAQSNSGHNTTSGTSGTSGTTSTNVPVSGTTASNAMALSPAPSGTSHRQGVAIGGLGFLDVQHAWAMGQLQQTGSPYFSVLRTSDGGQQWVNVTPPRTIATKISLNQGYATQNENWVVAIQPDKAFQVYRTTNGGRTWSASEQVPVKFGDGIVQLQFVNAKDGFLEDSSAGNAVLPGELFSTTDGGQTWQRVSTSNWQTRAVKHNLPFAGYIDFTSSKDGWLAGGERAGGPIGGPGFIWLYRTEDGGVTWQHESIPVPPEYQDAISTVSDISAFGKNVFVSITFDPPKGLTNPSVLYVTHNGGKSWSTVATPGGLMKSCKFINSNAGYIFTNDNLYWTTNGGQTWHQKNHEPVPHNFEPLGFVNPSEGWATLVGRNENTLLKTTDGGQSWHSLNPTLMQSAKDAAGGASKDPASSR